MLSGPGRARERDPSYGGPSSARSQRAPKRPQHLDVLLLGHAGCGRRDNLIDVARAGCRRPGLRITPQNLSQNSRGLS